MYTLLHHRRRSRLHERGQGLLEYALIIAFVVIVVVGGLVLLGPTVASMFQQIPPAL